MMGEVRTATRRAGQIFSALALLLAIGLWPASAEAQLGGELRMQMGLGGDKLATVEYSDGSESDLRLGTYFTISAGPVLQAWASGPHSVELQSMVGWSGWSTGPENTDDRLKLTRFPLELLAFYGYHMPARQLTLRFGGGATYHLGGGVSGSGSLDGTEMDIDSALGFTGEVTAIYGIVTAGLRYTRMSPTVEGVPDAMDGSSVGLFFGFTTLRK